MAPKLYSLDSSFCENQTSFYCQTDQQVRLYALCGSLEKGAFANKLDYHVFETAFYAPLKTQIDLKMYV